MKSSCNKTYRIGIMKRRFSWKVIGTQTHAVITYNNHSLTSMLSVDSSIIKIEYHKSGQECLEPKIKRDQKIKKENSEIGKGWLM